MELDELCKILQNWTNRNPLIILGSGASIPFELPSMFQLGEYLKNHISFSYHRDIDQFEKFKILLDKYNDLEKALNKISTLRVNVIEAIVENTWVYVNNQDMLAYDKIARKEVEFPLHDLLAHLLDTAERKASIITTNYDRLAEYAASLANAFINTGYLQNYIGLFNSDINKSNFDKLTGYSGQVNIWKVHGSLDWFKSDENRLYHLPLKQSIPKDYTPSIVTPGIGKYLETHKDPFRTIFSEADNAIKKANGFLCIGYGFNDEHVQPYLIDELQRNKPIVVIAKVITDATKQSIIDNSCKNYLLIEQDKDPKNTRIYSPTRGEFVMDNCSYWQLGEYLKLIKS